MKKARISLSFDDGRGDNWDVFQDILIPMSIPATINITTGYVDGSCPVELIPSSKRAVSVNHVRQLAKNNLVEIAMHGDCHLNTEEDIVKGREKLIEWIGLPEDYCFGFASPGSALKVSSFINGDSKLFEKQTSYLRTSLRIRNYRAIRILCRKIGRILHIPFLYRIAYADTMMDSCEDRVIYSIPIMRDTTYGQVKAMIDLTISRGCALTLMFHSILEDTEGEDNWSWSRRDFQRMCDYLKKKEYDGSLEVVTTRNLLYALQG